MLKTFVLLLIGLSIHLKGFNQEFELGDFFFSDFVPQELNIKSSDRIDSIYSNYIKRKGVVDRKGGFKDFVYHHNYFLDQLNKSGNVFYNDPISLYLNQIKDKILFQHSRRASIHVYLIYSSDLNAFTNDFENIYVNVATVAKMDSEAELAMIIAHEISHILLEHSYKTENLDMHLEKGGNSKSMVKLDELDYHQFSRENELEADVYAVDLLRKANLEIPNIYHVFDKLKYAGNPVYTGPVNSNLLFFNDLASKNYFEKIHKTSTLTDIQFVADTSLKTDASALKYATHPTIEKRIAQIQTALNSDSLQPIEEYKIDEKFEHIKQLAAYLYTRRLMDEGSLTEALYSVVKARELYPESVELAKIHLKIFVLLTQQKYRPNFRNQIINNYGAECSNQYFLKFKKSLLKIPALEMNVILEKVLVKAKDFFNNEYTYLTRLERFADQFMYKNNPLLFTIENKAVLLTSMVNDTLEGIEDLTIFYYQENIREKEEYMKMGYIFVDSIIPDPIFIAEFIKNFKETERFYNNIKDYKAQRNDYEKTLTLDQFLVSFNYEKTYRKFKKGKWISNQSIPENSSIALVQSDTYFVNRNAEKAWLDIEKTLEFDEIISDILEEDKLFTFFYTNHHSSEKEIKVSDNYSHYVLNKFIEDCWDLTDLRYSSVDEEVLNIAKKQDIEYLAYNMNFFIGYTSQRKRYGLFYSLYFDLNSMGVVYISKIASKQVPSKKLLRHFLYSSYSGKLN